MAKSAKKAKTGKKFRVQPRPNDAKKRVIKTRTRTVVPKKRPGKHAAKSVSDVFARFRKSLKKLKPASVKTGSKALGRGKKSSASPWAQLHWFLGVVGAPVVISVALWRVNMPPISPADSPVASVSPQVQQSVQERQAAPAAQQFQAEQPASQPPAAPAAQPAAAAQQPAAPSVAAVPVAYPMEKEFAQAKFPGVGDRVVAWSEMVAAKDGKVVDLLASISKVYQVDDSAPLMAKKFDCTTFVETVAALARSSRADDVFPNLLAIRYKDGKANFLSRNHFPEADWIPNNVKAGILADITESVAGAAGVATGKETKEIRKADWLAKQVEQGKVSRSLASAESGWEKSVQATASYIPLDQVSQVVDRIPSGAIVNLVRKNSARHPVLITHQGFVVKDKGKIYLRHATPSGKIYTVELLEYLKSAKSKESSSWPLIGINLNQLNSST